MKTNKIINYTNTVYKALSKSDNDPEEAKRYIYGNLIAVEVSCGNDPASDTVFDKIQFMYLFASDIIDLILGGTTLDEMEAYVYAH